MIRRKINILSTKELEDSLLIDISCIANVVNFDILKIEPVIPSTNKFYKNIIFTSYKATLRGLEVLGEDAHNHHYFCVGKKSEHHLSSNGFEVYGFANYSKDLAELLVENLRNSSFSYLCSEDRLDYLPNILKENKVVFEEVFTYQSNVVDAVPQGDYDIYLWFSPKGVMCYRENIPNDAIHICIGQTTASVAKALYGESKVYCPDQPKLEDVIELARLKALDINLERCAQSVSNV